MNSPKDYLTDRVNIPGRFGKSTFQQNVFDAFTEFIEKNENKRNNTETKK